MTTRKRWTTTTLLEQGRVLSQCFERGFKTTTAMQKDTIYPMDSRRQDWHQTSSEVAHHYRPGYYFPSSKFQAWEMAVLYEPLPPDLAKPDELTNDQKYQTTTGTYHDRKYKAGVYGNPAHTKAPTSRKVNYIKEHVEQLGAGGWRKPLTMGNQLTETQEQYQAKKGVRDHYNFEDTFVPSSFLLHDHYNNGPSKYGEATSQNPKLQGTPWYVKDKSLLRLLDPYCTTTQRDHRVFTPSELKKYPKKDIATYWQCEDYPKAWGHGLKHNPVPKDSVPRERLPMRDPIWFKTPTKIPRIPKSLVPVPHTGLKSEQKSSFTRPSDVRMKENYFCPVDTPFVLPEPGSKMVMTAPKMYKTEYQNVGSGHPITV